MFSSLEKIGFKRNPLELLLYLAGALVLFGFIVFGGELGLIALNGLFAVAALVFVAYRYPAFMIAVWMFSTQIMVELIVWDYDKYFEPSLNIGGGIDMLYGDPILFGIIMAMFLKLASGDQRARTTLYREISIWSIFMLWMVFELVRSFAMFGPVNALGEFRTYFREIVIIPYVIMFIRTRGEQWRAFQILLWSMLFLILVGFFRGGYVHKFRFAAYAKWLYQHGSLGLLWGTLALYLMHQFGYWRRGNVLFGIIIASSLGLTLIASHRSVWLAAFIAVIMLLFMGYFKFSNLVKMGVAFFIAALTINFVYSEIDLVDFIQERLVALTDPTEDQTANWRYLVWQDALEQSKAFILEGKGLGNYFSTRLPNGMVVEVMLHNQYIQLIYQVGVIGLVLYLGFLIQMYRRLSKTYRETSDPFYRMIALLNMVIIVSVSAYYVAYEYEPFTWLFVGLGLSVSLSHYEQQTAQYGQMYTAQPDEGVPYY